MQSRLVALALILALVAPAHAQQVTATWTPSISPGIVAYRVYRRTPGGTYALIGTAATAPFVDPNVTAGATYLYVATAVDGSAVESVFSNEATAVIPGPPPPPPTGLVSLWPTSAVPANTTGTDGNSVELGVKFSTSVAGAVVGLRFWKVPNSTVTHTGSLWNATGGRLATGTFTGETGSGWQTLTFATPINITVGASYTVSYHTVQYPWTASYFASAGRSVPPLTAPINAGVYRYGTTSAQPTLVYFGGNYWVDVLFQPSGPPPPPPVTITIAPTSTTLLTGGAQQFTATVANTTNTFVSWTATGGSVSSTGVYTAGSVPGGYGVTATSAADPTKKATATVTVNAPPPALSVSCNGLVCTFTPANIPSGTPINVSGVSNGVTASTTTTVP